MLQTLEKPEIDESPVPLYHMALAYATTKVLLTAQKLGIFESLGTSQKTASQVAKERSLHERSTELLLNTCVSLKLCEKTGPLYANTPMVERYLVPGRRGYLGRFMDHFNDLMYPTWSHLDEAIRTGHAQIQKVVGENNDNFFAAIDRQLEHLKTFMETMEEHSLLEGKGLADVYDFSSHRRLLDVAGGTGAMSVAILEKYPHMTSMVFDRPPVCELAQKSLRAHGMQDKITTHAGDFLQNPLPMGADVVLLSAILHNWPPEQAQVILRQIHRVLPPGGTLLISDQVLDDDKTGPLAGLLCSLNMVIMMEGAQEYSRAELEGFLQATGFKLQEVRQTSGVRQLLIAQRQ